MPSLPSRGVAASIARVALLATVCVAPCALGAQGATRAPAAAAPASALGGIVGTVIDSLTGARRMAGAEVYVAESPRSAVTDAYGHFRIDSLPAGRYTIAFSHPMLDSLGLGVAPGSVTVLPGAVQEVTLVTPSARSVARALCPGQTSDTTGALIGVVTDANGGAPVGGAHVSAVWTTFVQTPSGVLRVPKSAAAVAGPTGVYRACGISVTGQVTVRASAPVEMGASDPKSGIGVAQLGGGLGMLNLAIAITPVAAAGAPPARRPGTPLVVTVTRPDGRPVAGAQVTVAGDTTTAITDDAGRAQLANAPLGTRAVEVRAIGYSPQLVGAVLRGGQTATASVRLERAVAVLDTVKVLGRADRDLTGFSERQRTGMGYYLDEKAIDARHAIRFSELLRTVPGVTLSPNTGAGQTVLAMRGSAGAQNCVPSVYVDGITAGSMASGASASLDEFLAPGEVAGIEVYPGSAGVPPQYAGRGTCGTILVWTRTGRPAARR